MREEALHVGMIAAVILVAALPVRSDLVAHWSLDDPAGSVSILDSGPSERFHGTPVFEADPKVTFGVEGATVDTGTAATFSTGSIDVPFDAALNPESFTFSVWAKAGSVLDHQSIVTSRHDAFPELYGYILYIDPDGNWSFWTGRSGGWDGLVGPPVVLDTWTHVAISFDSATATKALYVDGVPVSTSVQTYRPNLVRDLHLGGGGDLGTQYYFDGVLDDAALWSVALTAEDIISVRSGGPSAVPDDMVAHWRLDELEGTTGDGSVVDSAGGGHDGGPSGAPFAPGRPGATPTTGTAIEFKNASIDVPFDPELNPESFALTVWVKPGTVIDHQSIVTSRHDASPDLYGYILYIDPSGNWSFWTGRSGGWDVLVGPPVVLGTWTHVAISFDAETLTKALYVNGVPVASTLDQAYVPNGVRDLHIGGGADLGDRFRFVGTIDDVGLWDEPLGEERIQDIMDRGVDPGEDPVRFSRGDADSSGAINITDGIFALNFLFLGGPAPPCADAVDADDSGAMNITDAIFILNFLFLGGPPPAAPHEACGLDATGDALACESFTACR
jgi:hypothetical protein